MPLTVLLTGFGPFPGAPHNPTATLVHELARIRSSSLAGVQRIAHVFSTSYEAVDRELPPLIERVRPDAIVMFGLAARTRHIRIETQACNGIAHAADAVGYRPRAAAIVASGPAALALRSPAPRLLAAARSAGVPAALSSNAGRYLCNYLCWYASEAAARPNGPRLVAFIHVPLVRPGSLSPRRTRRMPLTLGDLVRAGEAIVAAAAATARLR